MYFKITNIAITGISPSMIKMLYEKYNNDGECVISAKSEWSDDGARWMMAHALGTTGNSTFDQLQEDYAKFSLETKGLDIKLGGGSVSGSIWQFLELPLSYFSTVPK